MDWVKLATRYYADPKVAALPDADTEIVFIRGLAYAGDQETRGFIPDAIVPSLARTRRHDRCVKALCGAGLWRRVDHGYVMPAWSTWQDQLDVLAARRAADRERKRRKRQEMKPPVTSNVRGHSADVRVLEGETEGELPKGGMSTHDPTTNGPPPRTCIQHANVDRPPPCGPCADARRAHTAWRQSTRQPATTITPLDGQQAAARAREERTLRVVNGEACQACDDTGWTTDDNGNAVPCQCEETP